VHGPIIVDSRQDYKMGFTERLRLPDDAAETVAFCDHAETLMPKNPSSSRRHFQTVTQEARLNGKSPLNPRQPA
jgi:hypothetical protein